MTPIAINIIVIECKDSAGRYDSSRDEPLTPAFARVLTVDPVGSVEPGIIQKSRRAEQMDAFAFLIGLVLGIDNRPAPIQIETLGPHVYEFAVAGKQVRQRDGHLLLLDSCLEVLSCSRIAVVHDGLGQFLARQGIEPEHPHAAVQKDRPSREDIGDVILDQDASRDGPDGLELFVGHEPPVMRGRPESPDKRSI